MKYVVIAEDWPREPTVFGPYDTKQEATRAIPKVKDKTGEDLVAVYPLKKLPK